MNNLKEYSILRSSMKTGDIIAFQGADWGARAIRWGTKSKYSHVGMVVRIEEVSIDRVFIAESVVKAGVVLLPLSRKLKNYTGHAWWMSLKINENDNDKRSGILKWAMMELGKEYDKQLIGAIVKNILFKALIPQAEQLRYICSEYVATALKGIGLLPKGMTTNLTPKQITNLDVFESPKILI